jgi:hypothetical protein
VELHHDVHAVADRRADLLEGPQRRPQLLGAMCRPRLRSAGGVEGQIFMAVIPSSRRDRASSSARWRKASRSS